MTRRLVLMAAMAKAARACDHISHCADSEELRAQATFLHIVSAGLLMCLEDPEALPGFGAAYLADVHHWLAEIEEMGAVDMAPFHRAEAAPRN